MASVQVGNRAVQIPYGVLEGGTKNRVGGMTIAAATGNVTDNETPVPAGVVYLLDGLSTNLF